MRIIDFVQLVIRETVSQTGNPPDKIYLSHDLIPDFCQQTGIPKNPSLLMFSTLYNGINIYEDIWTRNSREIQIHFDNTGNNWQTFDFNSFLPMNPNQVQIKIITNNASNASFGSPKISGSTPNPVPPPPQPNSANQYNPYGNYVVANPSWTTTINGLFNDSSDNTNITLPKTVCFHDWKDYIGFTERYKYCSKCDQKDKT